MGWRNRSAIVIFVLMIASAFVYVGSDVAVGQAGPKAITVDGDPSDWTGVNTNPDTGIVSNGEFFWNDSVGDDTGDGDYTYPKASDLNRTGLFDIQELRITADSDNLYVLIKVANLSNQWDGTDGFSTVAAVLLIDTTLDTSGQLTARPNVDIASGSGWEYFVKIGQTGWHAENAKVFDAAGNWAPIANTADETYNAIEASVPLAFIGKDGYDINGDTWGFMFFLQSHDGAFTDGFRDVRLERYGEDWAFGGGANHSFDPKIQDIAFAASQTAQETELGSYTATSNAIMTSQAQVTFGTVTFAADTTPPQILSPIATPTFNQAVIAWGTDELANTTVWYGTADPPTLVRSVDEFTNAHAVTISGLASSTTYYYRIESWDIAGNKNITTVATFTTTAAPPANIAEFVGNSFIWEDQRGDDLGDGDYVYPNEPTVKWQGRGDAWFLNITPEGDWFHYSVLINAQPETEWRQRMAAFILLIDVDQVAGSGEVDVVHVMPEAAPPKPVNVSVGSQFAWEYVVVATFQNLSEFTPGDDRGEMVIRSNVPDTVNNTYEMLYLSTSLSLSPKPDAGKVFASNGGTQLDFWLNRTDLGLSYNLTYVAMAALYDDGGVGWPGGGIRQVEASAGNWVGGGADGPDNPNVYDLLFYPTTAAQTTDLSDYGTYAVIRRAMQVDLMNQTFTALYQPKPVVTHDYDVAVSAAPTSVGEGEDVAVTVTFTDNNVPLVGKSVSIAVSPTTAMSIVGDAVKTTDSQGKASFTLRGRAVETDTTVTITATGTNDTTATTGTTTVTVTAEAAPPALDVGLIAIIGGAVAAIIIIGLVVYFLFIRGRAPPVQPPVEPPKEPPE